MVLAQRPAVDTHLLSSKAKVVGVPTMHQQTQGQQARAMFHAQAIHMKIAATSQRDYTDMSPWDQRHLVQ